MICLGSVPAGTTIYIPFATYAGSTGASVTCTGLAVTAIEIYKDGSVTQRSSDAGYTLLDTDGTDFDGITGLHGFSIDLNDNTDASFFAVGSWYWVVVSAITVDSQTVTFLAAVFRIGPAESVTGYPKNDVHAINGSATAGARLERSSRTITLGTVGSGSTTTSVVASSLDPSSIEDDQWNGKIISFAHDTTTTALRGQSCEITDYVHSTLTFTVSALSESPASGDTFTIT